MHMHTHTHTHTHTVLRLSGFCLGLPWWAIGPLTLIEVIVVISHPLSASFISYDPWHPPCSIYVPVFSSFLINHEQWPVCCTTLLYRLVAAMFLLLCPPPPVGEQSIVVSVYVSVGLSVCLSMSISQEPYVQTSPSYLGMLPLALAQSSSGDIANVMYYRFVDDVMFSCCIGGTSRM